MKTYLSSDFNISKNSDITRDFARILSNLRGEPGEKALIFEKGTYYLSSKNSSEYELYITNTIGEKEWEKNENKNIHKVPIYIENISDLTIDFSGSTLVIDGVTTNIVIKNSKNIKIENVEIITSNPNLHELKVIDKKAFHVDYILDNESKYEKIKNKYYYVGTDYKLSFKYKLSKTWWIGDIKPNTPEKMKRTCHPFLGGIIKELEKNKFRVYYLNTKRFTKDELFYVFDTRRKDVGIFIDNSSCVTLYNLAQRFNYSLAIVCQHSKDLTFDKLDLTPNEDRKVVSLADFIQICMCSGKIVVKDSNFIGACDDCLNVHGFHFKIVNTVGNKITVRFMHSQSYGFIPFDKGDILAYIDSNTLLEKGRANVLDIKQINKYDIELTVDNVLSENMMVENVTKNPDLLFENNYLSRIITRGILVTTRGKVEILNNIFNYNTMSGVLISDDANNWYESGMVENVLIKGNRFCNTEEYDILIKPENTKFEGFVHNNITIVNNEFSSLNNGGIFVKDSGNVVIRDNIIKEKDFKITNKNSNKVK